uniref:Hydroxyproline-rich glycoprotein family protein n=1 Tax=Cucumis sativus TaxID=3659 RepID=A0A0A0LSA3_CUCSA
MKSSSYVFSKTYSKKLKLSKGARSKKSSGCKDNFVQMMELRKKILILRDIIDLPSLERSASINELVVGTMEDLQKLYPEIISDIQYSEMKTTCIEQSLAYFCTALKSIGDSWMLNHEWRDKSKYNLSSFQENSSFQEIVESVLGIIDCIVSMANERFDAMDEFVNSKDSSYSRTSSFGKSSSSTDSCSETNSSCCSSPETPTSVLANFRNSERKSSEKEKVSCSSPLLWSLRVQAVEKLNPIDVKHLLLPRLSHCGVNVCPAPTRVAIVEESMMDLDDKLPSENTDAADANNEMEVCDIKEEKDLSKEASQKADRNEEIEVFDNKEEKLNLSRTASLKADRNEEIEVIDIEEEKLCLNRTNSQKDIAERTDDFDSQATATVQELPTSDLPTVPPPPPPVPQMKAQPAAAGPNVPPPPPQLLKVIETAIKVSVPPPPPPSNTTGTMVRAGVPPPPPMAPSKGRAGPAPPPPGMAQGNGFAPPPPPPGGALRSLRAKKASTKLKRSHHLGNLYRTLKGKVEGSNQNLKSANGRKGGVGNSNGGKQGMADALAEMTKRSAYFQQIEEDVKKHAKSITALKPSISSFQSSDMKDLLLFHKQVESVLENLTDESQVLARFEGFPIKKLETLRIAAALYLKLDTIVFQLQNWKFVSPMGALLDRVENYFTKIKGEVDALERTKDEESKRFRGHGIQFDFSVLIRIKESMVDVSSGCMELALKEKRELKAAAEKSRKGGRSDNSNKASSKMLWRAFQFAYRVYTFAGGHDDRADRLTRELAVEIESESHHL